MKEDENVKTDINNSHVEMSHENRKATGIVLVKMFFAFYVVNVVSHHQI